MGEHAYEILTCGGTCIVMDSISFFFGQRDVLGLCAPRLGLGNIKFGYLLVAFTAIAGGSWGEHAC